MVKITKDNVKELWELYEYYKELEKDEHYSDYKSKWFEQFVEDEIEYCESEGKYEFKSEMFYCDNCGCWYMEDEKGTSELALQDGICEYCMENGYGE